MRAGGGQVRVQRVVLRDNGRSTEDAADELTGLRVFDQSFVHKSTNGSCRYDGDIGYVNSTHAAQGILVPERPPLTWLRH